MPVGGAGERIVPGDCAFFLAAGRTVVGREERVVVSGKVPSERCREER
jgi:hypothetical protein